MFKNKKNFAKYAWVYLIYNFYVILGGAYVRATGSGAGCGAHWPLCKGEIVPNFSLIHTIVEFTHRASSAIVTIGAIVLLVWAFQCTNKRDPIRKSAIFVFLFILVEALLGAALVLFELVANNSSNFRAVMMALHLVTTFMLLASITLTAAWASNFPVFKLKIQHHTFFSFVVVIFGLLIVGSSGAITALGDTLFRPLYVGEGLLSDIEYKSHILKSIRIYHPVLAILVSFYTVYICWKVTSPSSLKSQKFLCKLITAIVVLQICLGVINIALLAPIWMQIVHLFIADLLWVCAILFFNIVFSGQDSDKNNNQTKTEY